MVRLRRRKEISKREETPLPLNRYWDICIYILANIRRSGVFSSHLRHRMLRLQPRHWEKPECGYIYRAHISLAYTYFDWPPPEPVLGVMRSKYILRKSSSEMLTQKEYQKKIAKPTASKESRTKKQKKCRSIQKQVLVGLIGRAFLWQSNTPAISSAHKSSGIVANLTARGL